MAEAHASGGNELVFGQRPAISLAKLKQRAVGKPTVAVSLCSGDESWQEPRPHLRELRRDRVAQGKLGRASTEKLRLLRRDEGPRDRFDQSTRGEHASHAPHARLHFGQHRTRHPGGARHWRSGHAVDAGEPHNLLGEIDRHGNIRTPRWRSRFELRRTALELDAERGEERLNLAALQHEPAQALDELRIENERCVRLRRSAGDFDLARLAAADVEHHTGGELEARYHEGGIDASLESEPRIRLDIEFPARARGALRIEISGFDEHAGGCVGAASVLTADYAAEAEHAAVVGDDAHVLVDFVSLAVGRREGFTFLARPGADRAFELVSVIDMKGTPAVIENVVGEIDQRIDRPESDRLESTLKPLRARPVRYAPNDSAGEHR